MEVIANKHGDAEALASCMASVASNAIQSNVSATLIEKAHVCDERSTKGCK